MMKNRGETAVFRTNIELSFVAILMGWGLTALAFWGQTDPTHFLTVIYLFLTNSIGIILSFWGRKRLRDNLDKQIFVAILLCGFIGIGVSYLIFQTYTVPAIEEIFERLCVCLPGK
jgi:hypothetical protein